MVRMALIQTRPRGFFGFAVGVAGVVEEHGGAEAVDHGFAVADAEEVGHGQVFVFDVGAVLGHARAGVFDDEGAVADACGGVAACGVDRGGADDECHKSRVYGLFARLLRPNRNGLHSGQMLALRNNSVGWKSVVLGAALLCSGGALAHAQDQQQAAPDAPAPAQNPPPAKTPANSSAAKPAAKQPK